jgi:hypothetical protein
MKEAPQMAANSSMRARSVGFMAGILVGGPPSER